MNRWQKFIAVFVSPKRLFLDLDKNPTWGLPFAMVVVTSALTSIAVAWLKRDVILEQLRTKLVQQGLSESQVATAESLATGPFALFMSGVSTIVVTTIGFLLASAVVTWLVKLLDGQLRWDFPIVYQPRYIRWQRA